MSDNLQALGIPFKVWSVADTDPQCREFIRMNFSVQHMHTSMRSQIKGSPCQWHASTGASSCNPQQTHCSCENCSLGCSGTPCRPYSTQRAKRFVEGSVQEHRDHSLTDESLLEWIAEACPEAGFFENVEGWNLPEHQGSECSPLDRPVRPVMLGSGVE